MFECEHAVCIRSDHDLFEEWYSLHVLYIVGRYPVDNKNCAVGQFPVIWCATRTEEETSSRHKTSAHSSDCVHDRLKSTSIRPFPMVYLYYCYIDDIFMYANSEKTIIGLLEDINRAQWQEKRLMVRVAYRFWTSKSNMMEIRYKQNNAKSQHRRKIIIQKASAQPAYMMYNTVRNVTLTAKELTSRPCLAKILDRARP